MAIGVCAGFCYTIKFTGGFTTAAAFGPLLWQRRRNHDLTVPEQLILEIISFFEFLYDKSRLMVGCRHRS